MNRRYSLKKQYIIVRLLRDKKTVGSKNYTIYYKYTGEGLKIAISVSKKLGNAVQRNYQKRVCREIISQRARELMGYSIVFVAKPTSVDLLFNEKEAEINYLLNKISYDFLKSCKSF